MGHDIRIPELSVLDRVEFVFKVVFNVCELFGIFSKDRKFGDTLHRT